MRGIWRAEFACLGQPCWLSTLTPITIMADILGVAKLPKITIGFSVLLIAVGLGGYFGTGRASVTALIPAFVGGVFLICGAVALRGRWRTHMMHITSLLALLATLASGGRALPRMGFLFTQGGEGSRIAVIFVLLMMLICAAYFGLCLGSFMKARRQRLAERA